MDDNFKAQLHASIPARRGYAMSLLKSAADADDAVQEALLRAWRSRHTYQKETHFKAWIFRILVNVVKSGASRRCFNTVDLDSPAAISLGREPEQEWNARYSEVLAAMDRLSPKAREALLMVVGSGLSYEDAAAAAGVPVGTMKSRVNRAREALAIFVDQPEARGERTKAVTRPTATVVALEQRSPADADERAAPMLDADAA
ncbi:sigma-70 family RNA polymerase sigma factor [Phenylobacterium sp.]|uniref:sigma-70 family RNA polymerase sigma factor n=1 Tax=Phenylobacterium sp. TaxID=1871053 RepID=UPI002E3386DA|nr:sigma-70 family RNA polymerase sigma factor [Phenylobacterium sp.]HEX2562230.1 sigma-70 family RNA polymerase sigma factor [Phenylobacterium sp.]